jgi:L-malate glycosyltransferase
MKILVFLNQLIIGGAEVNSIDLNTMLRDVHGHDIVLFGTPGPMVKVAEEKGLRFLAAPQARTHPSLARMCALCGVVRREKPDLMQVWDWRASLDAYYSAHLLMGVPMQMILSNNGVDRQLPKSLPAAWMTPELVDRAKAAGRSPVELLLPPVDVHLNAPGAVDPQPFRKQYNLRSDEITLVTVSRLVNWLKGESLRRTIDAVRILGRKLPLKFVIVGDGDARVDLERLASEVNRELGRTAVVLTGAMLDPRPAYAAADIVIGMGGSSLRGMAFGKPVIVVGGQGFSDVFNPKTEASFLYNGMYGLGNGASDNAQLVEQIRSLVERADQLPALGNFSREFIVKHFSLEAVSARLADFSQRAVAESVPVHRAVIDGIRTAILTCGQKLVPDGLRNRIKRRQQTGTPKQSEAPATPG